ncbi:GTPase ObgE [Treponema sp.]|uniref:GTPase ObgE n=1 Tax=Treponema sp. TaxID=166 RepID=UPI00298D669A|nr:GTPase ObgE [Treponema sp.]MCR5613078.1 GTPase ObgE [Treponema sp.]
MIGFADEALIEVTSGKGGNGCISFRREKYVPNGGPSGGDGGDGGDIIFVVKRNLRTLAHLRYHPIIKAKNGSDGQSWNKYGKNGDDKIIPVPPGTTLRDPDTNELIYEFTTQSEDEQFVFLKGGKGGWGNVHFKTSTNQAPRYAHKGTLGETRKLRVELSIMADVGLVGFPNAGKSSLLTAFTNARPKIAPYPFTTKIPNLGVLNADKDRDIIIADIPGIIEGASEGAGLGIRFLKHISRTACLIFMIDVSDENYLTAYKTLCNELKSFSEELYAKPRIVLCNKIDVEGAEERAKEVQEAIAKDEPETVVLAISVLMNKGLGATRNAVIELVDRLEQSGEGAVTLSKKEKDEVSDFMKERAEIDEDMEVQYPGAQ